MRTSNSVRKINRNGSRWSVGDCRPAYHAVLVRGACAGGGRALVVASFQNIISNRGRSPFNPAPRHSLSGERAEASAMNVRPERRPACFPVATCRVAPDRPAWVFHSYSAACRRWTSVPPERAVRAAMIGRYSENAFWPELVPTADTAREAFRPVTEAVGYRAPAIALLPRFR